MFITLEGIEGCGKSTQAGMLKENLRHEKLDVVLTKEPGGSRLGKNLRKILLSMENTDLTREAELFLYLADRSQHIHTLIKPALEAGKFVISDRFSDSMIVYQGFGRGMDIHLLSKFNEVATSGIMPQLTILMDLPAEVGLKRAMGRNIEKKLVREEGRFEAENLTFHQTIREGYLKWAELNKDRFFIVDATQNVDQLFNLIWDKIRNNFKIN
ncbi:MAG: dTMP kinase [Desulfonatronovibrio sp. MSAO_Bac4]|nr:MAG: dTMP kinase [Desulfonatronovibrio sp. MSAO_Bac4]